MTTAAYEPSTIEAQAKGIVKALDPEPGAYRLEIDEFVQDGPSLTLFLLALENLQNNEVIANLKNDWKNTSFDDAEDEEKWIQKLSNNEKYWWSFFAIASIHGLPTQKWFHRHDYKAKESAFYCRHGTIVFPTWHRPYIFMMEQAVFNEMYRIARKFPEFAKDAPPRSEYIRAARSFRLPYWDPWMPRNNANKSAKSSTWSTWFGVPAILRAQEVFVRRPEDPSKLVEIDNPLYRYKVPRARDLLDDAMVGWTNFSRAAEGMDEFTIRNPSSQRTNKNNDIVLDYQLRTQALGENSKLWQLLVNMADSKNGWEVFSNHTLPKEYKDMKPEVSLESWHDNIHNLIGSGRQATGNMSQVPVAAFDPIFWLHHCNIDRLLALFQALHPDRYVPSNGPKDSPTLHTPLKPFYKASGSADTDYWNSADAEDWSLCGFAMPGTKRPTTETERKDLQKVVKDYMRENYFWISYRGSPPATLTFPKSMDSVEALIGLQSSPPPQSLAIKATGAQNGTASLVTRSLSLEAETRAEHDKKDEKISSKDEISSGSFPTDTVDAGRHRTWDAHFTVKKYIFNGSYNINFFIGHVENDHSADFMLYKNQIGYSGIFANPNTIQCGNCEQSKAADTLYADLVPLTAELTKYLESNAGELGVPEGLQTLKSLEPKDVETFLEEKLEWRVTTPDGKVKTPTEVQKSGLEIKVMSRWYNLPTREEGLGSYSEPRLHEIITRGKVGGYTE